MPQFTPYYEDKGNRSSVPVVFIHAFPLHGAMWDSQFSALSNDYRVVRYDVRGFGKSKSPDHQITIELLVDDLRDLLDRLELKQAVLCGLSMGGYIALRFAERFPDRVKGLILADTKSEADSDEAKIKRALSMAAIKKEGLETFLKGFAKGAIKEAGENAEKISRWGLETDPKAVIGALLALAARTDTTAALSQFHFPALVLVGKDDSLTPPEQSEKMAKLMNQATLVKLENAGHLSNLDQPERFTQELKKFLQAKF